MLKSVIAEVIGACVIGIGAIIIRKVRDKRLRSRISHKGRLISDSLFHSVKTVNTILTEGRHSMPVSTEFIDYGVATRKGYYSGDFKSFTLKIGDDVEQVELPYAELVDFTEGEAHIAVDTSLADEPYALPEDLAEKTRRSFDRFNSTGKLTSNDATVRVAGFSKKTGAETGYVCKVQPATYYDQVRTNLTLDFLLPGIEESTVRMLDLGPDNSLRPFEDSIMANTLGVSAVWVMVDDAASSRDRRFKFFLMPRRRKTGVYSGMLSSIGGVAKQPENMMFRSNDFVEYAATEMKREFVEECGVDTLVSSGVLDEADITMIPLAFVRDLDRGGKPQFFFLISTPVIPKKQLSAAFRKSFNGTDEFASGVMERMSTMYLSPETYSNLIYALRWLQRNNHTGFIDLGC